MSFFSETLKATWLLRLFGFSKIPMLFRCSPKVISLDESHCEVKIPLSRFTRNHEGSMYIGALTVGADIAGGLIAIYKIRSSGRKARFLFKGLKAEYHKRAEGDVVFRCDAGSDIDELVAKAAESPERHNLPVKVVATVPSKLGDTPVATFEMVLSIKDVTDTDPDAKGAL